MMKRLLLAVALAATGASATGEESAPRTGIFVLVDISETWLTPSASSANLRVLGRTFESVMDLLARVDSPVAISVGTIGQDSLLQQPVCEATFKSTLIGLSAPQGTFTQKHRLKTHLELCAHAVLARPVAKWTDIEGALNSVARAAESANYAQKFLIVLSDLKEEKPKGQGSASFRLDGFDVALVYRVLPGDSRNPAGLTDRLSGWSQKLRGHGAKRIVRVLDTAQFTRDLPAKLLGESQ